MCCCYFTKVIRNKMQPLSTIYDRVNDRVYKSAYYFTFYTSLCSKCIIDLFWNFNIVLVYIQQYLPSGSS